MVSKLETYNIAYMPPISVLLRKLNVVIDYECLI